MLRRTALPLGVFFFAVSVCLILLIVASYVWGYVGFSVTRLMDRPAIDLGWFGPYQPTWGIDDMGLGIGVVHGRFDILYARSFKVPARKVVARLNHATYSVGGYWAFHQVGGPWFQYLRRGGPPLTDAREGQWLIALPAPLILPLTALPVAGAFFLRKPKTNRLCRRCGYDLRATPTVCPECGTAAHGLTIDSGRFDLPARASTRGWVMLTMILLVVGCVTVTLIELFGGSIFLPRVLESYAMPNPPSSAGINFNESLIRNAGFPGMTESHGESLLECAVAAGRKDWVELLLSRGDDVNSTNDAKLTPLHRAALAGQLEICRLLLDHHANVNAKDDQGWTPLHIMFEVSPQIKSPEATVQLLLDRGADINARDLQGETPLQCALTHQNWVGVKVLLAHKADINAKDDNGSTVLHDAAANGWKDMVEFLLAHGADIDAKDKSGRTPLDVAADPAAGAFPFGKFAMAGRTSVVKLLISHKAQYNAFDAAATGDVDALKAFVNGNPDLVSVKSWHGNTLLHYAAILEKESMAEFLIANKAKVDAKNDEGDTPLHVAAEAGRRDIVELLLVNKANVNARDNAGVTPLQLAASMGHNHADVVELLLEHGADVNAKSNNGDTPLTRADRNGDVAKVLKQHGGHF
jgi:ankyrin repeat protein